MKIGLTVGNYIPVPYQRHLKLNPNTSILLSPFIPSTEGFRIRGHKRAVSPLITSFCHRHQPELPIAQRLQTSCFPAWFFLTLWSDWRKKRKFSCAPVHIHLLPPWFGALPAPHLLLWSSPLKGSINNWAAELLHRSAAEQTPSNILIDIKVK